MGVPTQNFLYFNHWFQGRMTTTTADGWSVEPAVASPAGLWIRPVAKTTTRTRLWESVEARTEMTTSSRLGEQVEAVAEVRAMTTPSPLTE